MILPMHALPSPEYPVWQEQMKLPSLSMQFAFTSHAFELALHSLISEREIFAINGKNSLPFINIYLSKLFHCL